MAQLALAIATIDDLASLTEIGWAASVIDPLDIDLRKYRVKAQFINSGPIQAIAPSSVRQLIKNAPKQMIVIDRIKQNELL